MQLQIFLTGFTSGDCGGNSISCLSLFLNHAYIAMAMWQGALSCWNRNVCCWSLSICFTDSSKFPPMRSIYTYRIQVDISIYLYQIAKARKVMHPQTITKTFSRSRNRIASGFILYQLILQYPPLPSLVCKTNLLSSESTTKDQLPLMVQC